MRFNEDKMQLVRVTVDKRLEEIIPKLPDDKYQALKHDIEVNGLKVPIALMITGEDDEVYDAVVVDGHHRFRACAELKKLLKYPDNFTVLDMNTIEEALEYSFEINFHRRQLEAYPSAKWAILTYKRTHPNMSLDEIGKKVGIAKSTISKTSTILNVSTETSNRTDEENLQVKELVDSAESSTKGLDTVYTQLKVAEDVSNAIAAIDDEEIQEAMQKEYLIEKYTDKTAVKDLAEDIRLLEAEKAGKKFEASKYDKESFPVMEKCVKLQEKYSQVNTVTFAGNQESIDNALEAVRKVLMNEINKSGGDIIEAVRAILTEELESKRDRDIATMLKKIKEILPEDNTRYFFCGMVLPRNPKGVA